MVVHDSFTLFLFMLKFELEIDTLYLDTKSRKVLVNKLEFCINDVLILHFRQGHLSTVVLLMSLGADPKLQDGEGMFSLITFCPVYL
jgi:hypothetical protein